MILFLFWISVILIFYTYIGFPWLIFLRGLVWHQPYESDETVPLPSVSLIVAAYNEEEIIEKKLDNIRSLDYPRDKFEAIIASDGSTDKTDEIVKKHHGQIIKLLSLPRLGKAEALNTAVASSKNEILVFSDANSIYNVDAVRALVQPLADPTIGGVAGNQCYMKEVGTPVKNVGESSYWNFDRIMKISQSRAGNTISATGAIYAIRRSLFQPVPEGVTDDFVTSTSVIEQGYRLVFAPDAVANEPVASSNALEFGRKVRVITRGLRAIFVTRVRLLNPFKFGFYAIQLFSHKVLRRLVAFPLLLLLLVTPFLWGVGVFYQIAMIGQFLFYGSAILGLLLSGTRFGRAKLFSVPLYFCMVNAAAIVATINIMQKKQIKKWEPTRI